METNERHIRLMIWPEMFKENNEKHLCLLIHPKEDKLWAMYLHNKSWWKKFLGLLGQDPRGRVYNNTLLFPLGLHPSIK